VLFQESIDGAQALGDSLGVVETVDADADNSSSTRSRLRQRSISFFVAGLAALSAWSSKSMLMGKGRTSVVLPHGSPRKARSQPWLHGPIDSVEEVLAVVAQ